MNSINVVLTVIMFALFAVSGLLVKFPDKGDDLMVQLAKGQLFSEEGVYTGTVESVKGTIEQRIPNGGGWKALAPGDKIVSGMEIRTLAESKAKIKFDENSVLHMDEVTQLVFENKLYQINISLINGFVYNEVCFANSRKYTVEIDGYRVETPIAEFAVAKDFQASPELLVFKESADIFMGEEKKRNLAKGKKVYFKNESLEEAEISKNDFIEKEIFENK